MAESDLNRQVAGRTFKARPTGRCGDLVQKLRDTYCRTIGVEYVNISDKQQREWLAERMEPTLNRPALSPEECRAILYQLVASEEFEQWLHRKCQSTKRFSLEGAESLIPMLNVLVDEGARGSACRKSAWACPTAAGSTCWPMCSTSPTKC